MRMLILLDIIIYKH